MYLSHPKDTLSFDADTFIKENEEILQSLKQEAIKAIPGSYRDQNIMEQRSAIITYAVWHNFESLSEIPTNFSPDVNSESEIIMDIFNKLLFWLTLECMSGDNVAQKVGDKYRNTVFMEGVSQRKKKVFGKKRVP